MKEKKKAKKIKKTIVVGIDPGKKGGIAVMDVSSKSVTVLEMFSSMTDFITFFKELKSNLKCVFIEKQQPFPGQGVVSTFNLGKHYGELTGVLKALSIPYVEVDKVKWKRHFNLLKNGMKHRERKKLSIEKAVEAFPFLSEEVGSHDGKAEALLILAYGLSVLSQP